MIPGAMPAGTSVLGRFNHAGLVEGERPDEGQPLILQVQWGAAKCLSPYAVKTC